MRRYELHVLDTDMHSSAYAIWVLQKVLGYSTADALLKSREINALGHAPVFSGHFEQVEFKRTLIQQARPEPGVGILVTEIAEVGSDVRSQDIRSMD